MKIADLLDEDLIVTHLKGENTIVVLRELVGVLVKKYPHLDPDRTVEVLLGRERLGSTGVGDGVAIPHAKLPGLDELILCFGRRPQGVDFQAQDNQPVKLFLVLLVPEDSIGAHLKVLARISRLFRNALFRQRLLEAGGAEDILNIIKQQDDETP